MKKMILTLILIIFGHYIQSQNKRFTLLTDTHISRGSSSREDLENSVKFINAPPKIKYVIASGDITEKGDKASMETVKSVLDQLNVKYYITSGKVLTAINISTGETLWRTKESMVRETISLSEDKKRIYSKTMQDNVVCYSASTDTPIHLWSTNLEYGYDHAPSMPLEKGGIVFESTKNGLIFSINDKTRKLLWKHKIGNSLINTVIPIGTNKCVYTSAEGIVGFLKFEN